MKRFSVLTALLLALALVVSGCSSGPAENSAETAPATSSAPAGDSGAAPAPADDDTVYNIISAMAGPEETSMYYRAMRDLVNERLDGRITMEIHWNGTLSGINREQLEMTRDNLIQWQSVPAFEFFTQSPNLAGMLVFDLPYIFDSPQQLYDFMDSDFAHEKLYPDVEKELGVTILGGYHMGFVELGTVKSPVTQASEVRNLKIRTSLSEIYIDMVKGWGAAPTSLEWGECYTALQQGAIDGLTTSVSLMVAGKMEEPLSYVTMLDAIPFNHLAMFNTEFLNSAIPGDLKEALLAVQAEANVVGRKATDELDATMLTMLEESCEVVDLTPEQKATFTGPAKEIWESKADLIGREVLEGALAEVGKSL